jgi:mortality factor 4-like protein 1
MLVQEEDFVRRPAVRLYMPDALKSILVDDWEKVTKEQKLAQVPSPTPVTKFLNEYEDFEMRQRRPGSADADILEEIVSGVKEYFNKSLGRILLYRFERQQFYEMHKAVEAGHGEHAGKTLADVYGCEHLLRLFGMQFYSKSINGLCLVLISKQFPCPTSLRTRTWIRSLSADYVRSCIR